MELPEMFQSDVLWAPGKYGDSKRFGLGLGQKDEGYAEWKRDHETGNTARSRDGSGTVVSKEETMGKGAIARSFHVTYAEVPSDRAIRNGRVCLWSSIG